MEERQETKGINDEILYILIINTKNKIIQKCSNKINNKNVSI